LKLESSPGAPLHLDKKNPTLKGLVDYSSEGGGNIAVKIDGISKKLHTEDTISEIDIGAIEMNGSGEFISKIMKDLLK
jgi:hypothetical protein